MNKELILHFLSPTLVIRAVRNEGGFFESFNVDTGGDDASDIEEDIYLGKVVYHNPATNNYFVKLNGAGLTGFMGGRGLPSLEVSDYVLVQVKRNATYMKKPLLKTEILLPGDFLLLTNKNSTINFSRKIEQTAAFRRKYSKRVLGSLPKGVSVIIRQPCIEDPKRGIHELRCMTVLWLLIDRNQQRMRDAGGVGPLYSKNKSAATAHQNDRWQRVETNSKKLSQAFLGTENFHGARVVEYSGVPKALLGKVQSFYSNKVQLSDRTSLFIEKTEMGWTVDVNSGSPSGDQHNEDIFFKINLTAVTGIYEQIMCRGMSGIIVIDFININNERQKHVIIDRLREISMGDKVKVRIHNLNQECIALMSRQTRNSKPLSVSPHLTQYLMLLLQLQSIFPTDNECCVELRSVDFLEWLVNNRMTELERLSNGQCHRLYWRLNLTTGETSSSWRVTQQTPPKH